MEKHSSLQVFHNMIFEQKYWIAVTLNLQKYRCYSGFKKKKLKIEYEAILPL